MTCFYLHSRCDGEFCEDEEGMERADLEAAIVEAVRSVRSLVAADVQRGELHLNQSIDISDNEGRHLTTVHFGHAIRTIPARQEDGSVHNV